MKTNRVIQYITSEQAGIRSEHIEQFVRRLEENGLATHSLILARGNRIFFEHYWEPFHSEFLHRMYSVSKSFVAIAIGFLEQDGLIGLDESISKYFGEELKNQPDQYMHDQTLRHMLMMSTAKPPKDWFTTSSSTIKILLIWYLLIFTYYKVHHCTCIFFTGGSLASTQLPAPMTSLIPDLPAHFSSMIPQDPLYWGLWWSGLPECLLWTI